MRSEPWFWLALSPEGTRGFRDHLRSGFYHLALAMQVRSAWPSSDYGRKSVGVRDYVHMSGDVAADLQLLREFYADRHGLYPEKAATIAFRKRADNRAGVEAPPVIRPACRPRRSAPSPTRTDLRGPLRTVLARDTLAPATISIVFFSATQWCTLATWIAFRSST